MSGKGFYLLSLAMWFAFGHYVARAYHHFTFLEVCAQAFLLGLLIIITEKNVREAIYKDEVTIPTIVMGIVVTALIAFQHNNYYLYVLKNTGLSLAGILIGGGSLYLFGVCMDHIFKKESLGGGDVKLVAGMGSFVGIQIGWYLPIWVVVFLVIAVMIKIIGVFRKENVASTLPTAPVHFISLFILLTSKNDLMNTYVVGICSVLILLTCWVLYKH